MFNLLVTAADGAWSRPSYTLDAGRFLEYTEDEVKARFGTLDDLTVEILLGLPTLFAYETFVGQPASIGRIRALRRRGRDLLITFTIDADAPKFDSEQMQVLCAHLGISGEMSRTHFAVKQGELWEAIREAGISSQGPTAAQSESPVGFQPVELRPATKKVFVVHGRDAGAKHEVARFLEQLGLEAVILHERPNGGRTLISKFREESADISYAVVLMTPDDVGRLAIGSDLRPRARQNVVFELGFFVGKLGPSRVCALVTGDVERPSDFEAVVFEPLDPGGAWRLSLARELKGAGVPFDPHRVLARP